MSRSPRMLARVVRRKTPFLRRLLASFGRSRSMITKESTLTRVDRSRCTLNGGPLMGPLGPCLRRLIAPRRLAIAPAAALILLLSAGCHHHPFWVAADVKGDVHADAHVQAGLQGTLDV